MAKGRVLLAVLAAGALGFVAAGMFGAPANGTRADAAPLAADTAVKEATYQGLVSYYTTVISPQGGMRLLATKTTKATVSRVGGLNTAEIAAATKTGSATISRWLTGPAKTLQTKTMNDTLAFGRPGGVKAMSSGAAADGQRSVSSAVILDGGIDQPMTFVSVTISGSSAKVVADGSAWEDTMVYYSDGTSEQVKSSNTDHYVVSLLEDTNGEWQVSDYTLEHS